MKRTTALGQFSEWLLSQIPPFVEKTVVNAVKKLPEPKNGTDGKDGVSVVDSEIALDGHLVLKLSNGKIIDAGELVDVVSENIRTTFTQYARDQIIVSRTAPPNPSVGDLWYDIS